MVLDQEDLKFSSDESLYYVLTGECCSSRLSKAFRSNKNEFTCK